MKLFPFVPCALALALALSAPAWGQQPVQASSPSGTATSAEANSAIDGELFYQLLLGEISLRTGEPGTGFSLLLDAARKTNDPNLYQRAVDVALQARSGDPALQAARAWKTAQPTSREANRYVLQILVALNRIAETLEPLKTELALVEAKDRSLAISSIPRNYARVTDKKAAATVVEQALADQVNARGTAAAAWTANGRMRLAAGDAPGALDAAQRAQAADATAEGPALLALELMDPKQPLAEPIVKKYLDGQPIAEIRMGYARNLLDAQRYAEASQQLQTITKAKPDYPEAWLVLGTLQLQDSQAALAEASLKRYIELAPRQAEDERNRGLTQAYLALARVAEQRKDFPLAQAWLDKIDSPEAMASAQNRRASILARQGRMDEARKLIRSLPERNPAEARAKLSAEVQLLRDNKQYKAAYDLLIEAVARDPKDADLLYDQAMMAEKLERFGEMERLLRQLMAAKPDFHHAYNALGYSMAERHVRLPEAKQLIQKALEFAPGDPYISDSLAWVEFRLGNKAEALRILETAYKSRPDAEIAAHLGEVLWSMGQRERAIAIWKEGALLNADNDTLQETLKRLRVKL